MFTLRGKQVAGVGPIMQEGQPPVWSTYVATDDADAAAARVTEAGGNVLFGPMDVMDAGRMAVFAHPAAGMLGVWQAGRHTGAELVNEPGALNWNELQTRDVEGAKAFYAAVFGWTPDDQDFGGMTYTLFNVGDAGVAGAMPTPSAGARRGAGVLADLLHGRGLRRVGGQGPGARRQRASGARTPLEGVGRFAVVADPHGATFGVIAGEPPEE